MSQETKETAPVIRKFRVIAGTHMEGKKAYVKGKIVKSSSNLAALFVNKFTEVAKRDTEGDEAEDADKAKTSSPKTASKNRE